MLIITGTGLSQNGTKSTATSDPCINLANSSTGVGDSANAGDNRKNDHGSSTSQGSSGVKVSISQHEQTRLAVGYSLRLSATVSGATDTSVEWSVVGPGCSGPTCGRIEGGLYLAPTIVPNPPIVKLIATSKADPRASDSTAVCIVQHGPQWNLLSAAGGIQAAAIGATLGATRTSGAKPGIGGLEILTNTEGVDFGSYLQGVVANIKQHWYAIIPQRAMAPVRQRGKVMIEFTIEKDGRIARLRYASTSGDEVLDRAAYEGITDSNPLLPLPAEFRGPYLGLRFTFFYNPSLTAITPASAQVRAGSSLQFSSVLEGITEPSASLITWRVGGRLCAESACGTISDSGLYTAPLMVPDDPNVTVEARAAGDLGETASAVVTILPPDPSRNAVRH